MQIILASAKIMHDKLKSVPNISLSTPRFQNEAQAFAKDMAQYSTEMLAEILFTLNALYHMALRVNVKTCFKQNFLSFLLVCNSSIFFSL